MEETGLICCERSEAGVMITVHCAVCRISKEWMYRLILLELRVKRRGIIFEGYKTCVGGQQMVSAKNMKTLWKQVYSMNITCSSFSEIRKICLVLKAQSVS